MLRDRKKTTQSSHGGEGTSMSSLATAATIGMGTAASAAIPISATRIPYPQQQQQQQQQRYHGGRAYRHGSPALSSKFSRKLACATATCIVLSILFMIFSYSVEQQMMVSMELPQEIRNFSKAVIDNLNIDTSSSNMSLVMILSDYPPDHWTFSELAASASNSDDLEVQAPSSENKFHFDLKKWDKEFRSAILYSLQSEPHLRSFMKDHKMYFKDPSELLTSSVNRDLMNPSSQLMKSLDSWHVNGLFHNANDIVFLFQTADPKSARLFRRNLPDYLRHRVRVYRVSPQDSATQLTTYGVMAARYELVLFLDDRFELVEPVDAVKRHLDDGKRILLTNTAIAVRYRHRWKDPYLGDKVKVMFQGREESLIQEAPELTCSLYNWILDPTAHYDPYVHHCKNAFTDFYCSESKYCNWLTAPSMFRRSWFLSTFLTSSSRITRKSDRGKIVPWNEAIHESVSEESSSLDPLIRSMLPLLPESSHSLWFATSSETSVASYFRTLPSNAGATSTLDSIVNRDFWRNQENMEVAFGEGLFKYIPVSDPGASSIIEKNVWSRFVTSLAEYKADLFRNESRYREILDDDTKAKIAMPSIYDYIPASTRELIPDMFRKDRQWQMNQFEEIRSSIPGLFDSFDESSPVFGSIVNAIMNVEPPRPLEARIALVSCLYDLESLSASSESKLGNDAADSQLNSGNGTGAADSPPSPSPIQESPQRPWKEQVAEFAEYFLSLPYRKIVYCTAETQKELESLHDAEKLLKNTIIIPKTLDQIRFLVPHLDAIEQIARDPAWLERAPGLEFLPHVHHPSVFSFHLAKMYLLAEQVDVNAQSHNASHLFWVDPPGLKCKHVDVFSIESSSDFLIRIHSYNSFFVQTYQMDLSVSSLNGNNRMVDEGGSGSGSGSGSGMGLPIPDHVLNPKVLDILKLGGLDPMEYMKMIRPRMDLSTPPSPFPSLHITMVRTHGGLLGGTLFHTKLIAWLYDSILRKLIEETQSLASLDTILSLVYYNANDLIHPFHEQFGCVSNAFWDHSCVGYESVKTRLDGILSQPWNISSSARVETRDTITGEDRVDRNANEENVADAVVAAASTSTLLASSVGLGSNANVSGAISSDWLLHNLNKFHYSYQYPIYEHNTNSPCHFISWISAAIGPRCESKENNASVIEISIG